MAYTDKKLKSKKGMPSVDTGPYDKRQAKSAVKKVKDQGHAVRMIKRNDGKYHLYIDGPLNVDDTKKTQKDLAIIKQGADQKPLKKSDTKKADIAPKKRGRPKKDAAPPMKAWSKQYGDKMYRRYLGEEAAMVTKKEKKTAKAAKANVKAVSDSPKLSQYEKRKLKKAEKKLAEAAQAKTQPTQNKKARQAKAEIKAVEKSAEKKLTQYQKRKLRAAEKKAAEVAKTPQKKKDKGLSQYEKRKLRETGLLPAEARRPRGRRSSRIPPIPPPPEHFERLEQERIMNQIAWEEQMEGMGQG